METDKENTSSYLQKSFQSPSVANYPCNASSASRVKTMRPLTSGMGTSESEVSSFLHSFIAGHNILKSLAFFLQHRFDSAANI